MRKIILISIFIIVSLGWFSTKFVVETHTLVSPQFTNQDRVEEKMFKENKDKVKTEKFEWAVGTALQDNLIDKGSYVVVDGTGKVVLAKDADLRRAPASLVKLMTAMVSLDFAKPDTVYTVPKEATNLEPTTLVLGEGEKLSVHDLLTGGLITSANDAAYTLAYGTAKNLGGGYSLFVKLMNEKAKNLGLINTHFSNATGYDTDDQYSTARDLAKLSSYALKNYPEIKSIVALRSSKILKTSDHKIYELPNWNALLGVYPGVTGVKIGHTDHAGHSTIVTSTREGKTYMVVLLGAPDIRARDTWTATLLNSGFRTSGIKSYRVTLAGLQKRSQEWNDQLKLAREESEAFGENVPRKVDVDKTVEE